MVVIPSNKSHLSNKLRMSFKNYKGSQNPFTGWSELWFILTLRNVILDYISSLILEWLFCFNDSSVLMNITTFGKKTTKSAYNTWISLCLITLASTVTSVRPKKKKRNKDKWRQRTTWISLIDSAHFLDFQLKLNNI